jgi:branched-chain amino acid aminotransferase
VSETEAADRAAGQLADPAATGRPSARRARYVWADGLLVPADTPLLPATDRGFQLGDGVFETIRVCEGRILELPLHAERLRASAAALGIPLPDEIEATLRVAIAELLAADELGGPRVEVSVRVTVTRGPLEGRDLLPPSDVRPTMVVQAWPVARPSPELLARGLHLAISTVRRDPRSPLAAVKTTSRAEFVYARLEARRRGADDALFLTIDGHLAEATSASVFLVKDDELATPALECGILVGTTREWLLRWAPGVGLRAREGWIAPDELFAADEALLASSVAGVLPVTQVDERPIGTGKPGRWTLRARAAREALACGEG